MNDTDLLRRVAAADPAPSPSPLDAEADAALRAILATPRRRLLPRRLAPRGRRGPRLALAGALAAAAVAGYVVTLPPDDGLAWPTAYPAATDSRTPLPYAPVGIPARPYLLALAERAEGQPRHAAGRYHYLRTEEFVLGRKNLPSGGFGAFDMISRTELWIGEHDGSGHVETDQEWGPGGEDAEPLPGWRDGPQKPGTFEAQWYWAPVPEDREALRERLHVRPDTEDRRTLGGEPAMWLAGFRRVWTSKAVEPGESATLLRALADVPGLLYRGGVTDRAGRPGVVVTYELEHGMVGHERAVLVLDEKTGAMLGYETEEHTSETLPDGWRAPVPSNWSMVLASGRVDSTDARP